MDISDAARGGAVSAARSRTRYRSALCRLPNAAGAHGPEELRLHLHIGPGNTPEPVLTILLPAEDQAPPKGPARSPDRADRGRGQIGRGQSGRALPMTCTSLTAAFTSGNRKDGSTKDR
jgi:hypothetical protein